MGDRILLVFWLTVETNLCIEQVSWQGGVPRKIIEALDVISLVIYDGIETGPTELYTDGNKDYKHWCLLL